MGRQRDDGQDGDAQYGFFNPETRELWRPGEKPPPPKPKRRKKGDDPREKRKQFRPWRYND